MDTYELTKEIMERSAARDEIMIVLACLLLGAAMYIIIMDIADKVRMHCEKKEARKAMDGGMEFRPNVTDCVQVDRYGTKYHKMGVPRR